MFAKIIVVLAFIDVTFSFPSMLPSNCGEVFIKHDKVSNVFSTATYNGEFPWHVAVYRREKYGSRTFICSGVLLNHNTVVTTAHCLYGDYGIISSDSLIVSLGKYDIDVSTSGAEELHVAEIAIHEKFDRFNLEHDIALIKMVQNATCNKYIQPICLAEKIPDEVSCSGIVIGWGHNKNGVKENLLGKGNVSLQMTDACRQNHNDLFQDLLHDDKICGKYESGTKLCPGDAGSGLFYEQNGRWHLRGIFSLGVSLSHKMHCDSAQILLFIDIVSYYDWIEETMYIKNNNYADNLGWF